MIYWGKELGNNILISFAPKKDYFPMTDKSAVDLIVTGLEDNEIDYIEEETNTKRKMLEKLRKIEDDMNDFEDEEGIF